MTDRRLCELVDGILTILGVPFKQGVIELGDRASPVHIGYNFYDIAENHGDGIETTVRYYVTFDIIGESTAVIDETYSELLELLIGNGFCRSGGSYTASSDYPKYYQKSVDFNIDIDTEDDDE